MKLSRKWLNEFIDLPITEVGDRAFAEAMSVSGSKVEATDDLTRSISGVICARVLSLEKHPDSDHMFVAQLDAGPHGVYQVVTGAWNVHQGDLVPLAVDGAHLPNGMAIRSGRLRGVESQGMLCSLKERGHHCRRCPAGLSSSESGQAQHFFRHRPRGQNLRAGRCCPGERRDPLPSGHDR